MGKIIDIKKLTKGTIISQKSRFLSFKEVDLFLIELSKNSLKKPKSTRQSSSKKQSTFLISSMEQGAGIPEKPYPLYQTYDGSCYPYIAWIFENFKDKCDFNARESLLKKHEEDDGKEVDEENEEDQDGKSRDGSRKNEDSDFDSDADDKRNRKNRDDLSQDEDDDDKSTDEETSDSDDNDSGDENQGEHGDQSHQHHQRNERGEDKKKRKSDEKTILHYLIESLGRFGR